MERKQCDKCVGLCCTFVQIPLPPHMIKRDIVRWLNFHESLEVKGNILQVNNKCSKLLPNGTCSIYETRPLVCRKGDGRDWLGRDLCKMGKKEKEEHGFRKLEELIQIRDSQQV